ncbi:MAG: nitrate/nitrite transporter NrtS [Actinomycetales bacterium]
MNADGPGVPTWTHPREAAWLVATGATFHTSIRVALVVGTLLTLVNQGGVIITGSIEPATWLRVIANYLIPYVVSGVGYLIPFRRR